MDRRIIVLTRIMMRKIPIENIYFLLCYAWQYWRESQIARFETDEETGIVDLFAKVLISGIAYLRRRGMDRGYIEYEEDTRTIRGKIMFGESVKRRLFSRAQAHCEYDRLSHNVLHNQLLKGTVQHLIQIENLNNEDRAKLYGVMRWLTDIEAVTPTEGAFNSVQLNRNNAFYGFLLSVCRIIMENLLVTEKDGKAYFRNFLEDKHTMNRIFEKFVYNFYKLELSDYDVSSPFIKWYPAAFEPSVDPLLPKMQTDIVLVERKRKRMIIIDAKFYSDTLDTHYRSEKKKINSANLYQIFAYLKNIERQHPFGLKCEGMLLYPTVEDDIDAEFNLGGHTVRVCTIKLDQDWRKISEDLLKLIA